MRFRLLKRLVETRQIDADFRGQGPQCIRVAKLQDLHEGDGKLRWLGCWGGSTPMISIGDGHQPNSSRGF